MTAPSRAPAPLPSPHRRGPGSGAVQACFISAADDVAEGPSMMGLLDHAPAFAGGAVTAWFLQWLAQHLWSRAGSAAASCLELRHMADALHAEVDAARGLLAQCRGERRLAAGANASAAVGWTAREASAATPGSEPVIHVVNISGTFDGGGPLAEAPGETAVWRSLSGVVMNGRLWGLGVVLLDTGLVYFCLVQSLSPAARASLEAKVSKVCTRLSAASARAAEPPVEPAAPAAAPLTPIDPSGGAVLVRRRGHAALNVQRKADMKKRWVTALLVALSFTGVVALRLVMTLVASAGLRFLEHLLIYAVLTVRLCLMVLLVLF